MAQGFVKLKESMIAAKDKELAESREALKGLREQLTVKVEGRPAGEEEGELRAKAASFALLNKQTVEANEQLKQQISNLINEKEDHSTQIKHLQSEVTSHISTIDNLQLSILEL